MNGHEDGHEDEYGPQTHEEYLMAHDDDGDTRTDIECPFCRHEVEWDGEFYCDNCEVVWPNIQALEADREDER